ncbi:MAG: hypothetical protein JST11_25800 [Acidobacteria bacterium]|nr:hypothetical protein [Acidobacteriota bacterium]
MRLSLLMATATLLGCTGCSDLISVNAFAPDNLVIQDAALPGIWADDDQIYVVKAKDDGYTIAVLPAKDNGTALSFTAKLFRAGNAEILDLVPAGDDAFRLAVHTPVRIWVDEHTLRFTYLDSKWLREQVRAGLTSQELNKRTLITSPAATLTRFLLIHGGDDRAWEGDPAGLVRQ